jgi:hypothetical protein
MSTDATGWDPRRYSQAAVKTRNLILLALAAGLAILVAGGVFLLNVARNRDALTLAEALAVGEGTEVGGRLVIVEQVETTGSTTVVAVRIEPRGNPGGTADEGWALVADGALQDPAAVPEADRDQACAGLTLAETPVSCVLAFAGGDGAGTLSYAYAGDQQQWQLGS